MAIADAHPSLNPDDIAGRTFSTHFRGYDTAEVKAFLRSVADAQRSLLVRVAAAEATEAKAAELLSAAEVRAAELLREAQDEARRIVEAVAGEREKAFAEGAARAEAVIADAEEQRTRIEEEARLEAQRLVAEAKGARHRVLDDLRRRRKVARAQVEQLNAARERLLAALAEVRSAIDTTTTGLRDVLPEVKAAADTAARRVSAEEETTIEQLEAEIDALKLAGLSLAAPAEAPGPPEGPHEERPGHQHAPAPEPVEEPAADAAGGAGPVAAPAEPPVETTVDRFSSSVRIVRPLRSQDPQTGLPEEELVPIEPPDPEEAVRLVGAGDLFDIESVERREPAAPAPAQEPAAPSEEADAAAEAATSAEAAPDAGDVGPTHEDEEGRPSQAAVDALFARLKAGREPASEGATAAAGTPATAEQDAPEQPERQPEQEAQPAAPPSAGDELLARRDATLEPATKSLNRHLKRLLAEEQNELLDRLRRQGTETAVPSPADHDAAWAEAASSELALAAAAGAAFPGGGGPVKHASPDDLVAVAEALADAIARPLRDRLEQVLAESDGDADVAGDGVRAVYRTWRSERLGPAIDHAVLDAFGLGVSVALGPGTPVTWLVDDGGVPCPDCDDDALAGALPCGEAFPTGHRRPPAHPGCRCLLVATT